MASTVVIKTKTGLSGVAGDFRYVFGTYTFDSSYPTNGLGFTKAQMLFPTESTLEYVHVAPASGYVFEYDYTNSKVKAYWSAASGSAMSEVTNTTDLHLVVTRFFAISQVAP